MVCDDNFNSSSSRRISCARDLECTGCETVGFGDFFPCTLCDHLSPPDPNCKPSNYDYVCGSFPENPVTRVETGDTALVDTLALPTTQGPLFLLPNYIFSCAQSFLLKGLPKHVEGLAALGRSKLSLQAQIGSALSSPRVVAPCFPASHKAHGVAIFGSTGPYYAVTDSSSSSKIDLSKSLLYTPLVVNLVAAKDTKISYPDGTPSDQYFIGLTSIKINDHRAPINDSLLTIHQDDGFGGTKISTATPYTVLESSIHEAFTKLFVNEASSSAFNLTVTTPVKPFNVCYLARDVTLTRVGPLVPTIDLVLHAPNVFWRIFGANSMVRVTDKKKGMDLWCLGFIDGGINGKTPITIGGKQLEDNLIQFDLKSNRLGFTSSLLSRSLSCPDLNVARHKN